MIDKLPTGPTGNSGAKHHIALIHLLVRVGQRRVTSPEVRIFNGSTSLETRVTHETPQLVATIHEH